MANEKSPAASAAVAKRQTLYGRPQIIVGIKQHVNLEKAKKKINHGTAAKSGAYTASGGASC